MSDLGFSFSVIGIILLIVLDLGFLILMLDMLKYNRFSYVKTVKLYTGALISALLFIFAIIGVQALLYFKNGHSVITLLWIGVCAITVPLIIIYYISRVKALKELNEPEQDEEWVADTIEPDTTVVEYYSGDEKSRFVLTQEGYL
jgi:hypothetical protein